MFSLAGKSALVIGAATGIGRAVSEVFAAQGAAVMIADHGHEAERAELVALLRGRGSEAFDMECDVLEEALVAGAVAATLQRFGKLDILVNNAGVGTAAQAAARAGLGRLGPHHRRQSQRRRLRHEAWIAADDRARLRPR